MPKLLLALLPACAHTAPEIAIPLPADLPADVEIWLQVPDKNCEASLLLGTVVAARAPESAGSRPATVVPDWERGPAVTCSLDHLAGTWYWTVTVQSAYPSMEDEIAAKGFPPGFRDAHPDYQWGDTPPDRRSFTCATDLARSPRIHLVGPGDPHLGGGSFGVTDGAGAPRSLTGTLPMSPTCYTMGG